MEEVSVIGIDLAKRSFQVHGAKADGSVAFRRKLSRGKVLIHAPHAKAATGIRNLDLFDGLR